MRRIKKTSACPSDENRYLKKYPHKFWFPDIFRRCNFHLIRIIRPKSFQQEKPYTIAIGRLKGGIKVLAWLLDAKVSEVRVGMKIKLVVKPNIEGEPIYMFIPT